MSAGKMVMTGVLAIFVAALLRYPLRLAGRWLWRKIKASIESRRTGLRRILSRKDFIQTGLVEQALRRCQPGDEVLVVGRTLRGFMEALRPDVLEALKNMAEFKVLVLDAEGIRNGTISTKPLQLTDRSIIFTDLSNVSIPTFRSICDQAEESNLEGSFCVRTCDFLVFDSMTCFTRRKTQKRELFLDFSFSDSIAEKYVQYYTCDTEDKTHFCNKLYSFYVGLFEQGTDCIRYGNGRLRCSAPYAKHRIAQDLPDLAREHSASELIRANEPRDLLCYVPTILDAGKGHEEPFPHPVSVQLELTNKCNGQCVHCQRHTWPDDSEMPTDTVLRLLDELSELGVSSITLSGGEPTLREDLQRIMQHAQGRGLHIGLLTNGLSIDQGLARTLVTHADWVRVSLDASNPDVYRRVRGIEDGFGLVMESMRNLEAAVRNVQGSNCKLGIAYCIQRGNIEDVPEMIDLVQSMEFSNADKPLTFKFAHGRGSFLCSPQELHRFEQRVLANVSSADNLTNLSYLRAFTSSYAPLADIARGRPLDGYFRRHQETRCFTPYLFVLVDAWGDVYPCCFLYYDNDAYDNQFNSRREMHRIGRFSAETSLREIWTGDAYRQLRKDLETIDVDRWPACGECIRHYLHNCFLTRVCRHYDLHAKGYDGRPSSILMSVVQGYGRRVLWL